MGGGTFVQLNHEAGEGQQRLYDNDSYRWSNMFYCCTDSSSVCTMHETRERRRLRERGEVVYLVHAILPHPAGEGGWRTTKKKRLISLSGVTNFFLFRPKATAATKMNTCVRSSADENKTKNSRHRDTGTTSTLIVFPVGLFVILPYHSSELSH